MLKLYDITILDDVSTLANWSLFVLATFILCGIAKTFEGLFLFLVFYPFPSVLPLRLSAAVSISEFVDLIL